MAETLRELVVALSLDSSNFSRNMRTINQQIKEAESTFRLAGAVHLPSGRGWCTELRKDHRWHGSQAVHAGSKAHPAAAGCGTVQPGTGGCE